MSIKKSVGNIKGFTLVELLIVVAIIGVLASQGVPAYRRMIQKSRKGEAQNFLAAISASEGAFFSEYGQYGNNLVRLGVQSDGVGYTYAAGMPAAVGCTQILAANVLPTMGTAVGQVSILPGNYSQAINSPQNNTAQTSMVGRVAAVMPAAAQLPVCPAAALGAFLAPGVVTGAAPTFVAIASGNIVDPNRACVQGAVGAATTNAAVLCDNWFINENRLLQNVIDGIQN
jgi:prepilin-type N-terminal cleavage/methylation domain-containing protein